MLMNKNVKDATEIYKKEMMQVCKMFNQMIVSEGDFIIILNSRKSIHANFDCRYIYLFCKIWTISFFDNNVKNLCTL